MVVDTGRRVKKVFVGVVVVVVMVGRGRDEVVVVVERKSEDVWNRRGE